MVFLSKFAKAKFLLLGSFGERVAPQVSDFFGAKELMIVGIYNDSNECLAVAKLSKPLVKDFTKEALIRIKLDY